jgi:glyceraldehyde 3-phosphate dehydrogenase
MEESRHTEKEPIRSLGINGLGRIGKLTLWHHLSRKYFDEIVINIGRGVGRTLRDVVHYIERDSTYGPLHGYLYGCKGRRVIESLDDGRGTITIDGVPVKILQHARNPLEIGWGDHGVELVVDTTGRFRDPTIPADHRGGSLRGHLDAGARKVVLSAPFKIKSASHAIPDDSVTTVMGINDDAYDPRKHCLISGASCTTTCLAHMIKPLIDHFGVNRILTASMATVHAATSSQPVLDRVAKSGATDLRKNRSVLNNIILTTTGAADTLGLVIPEISRIGFISESVRIPTTTGSLVILVVNLQEDTAGGNIRRATINNVYEGVSENNHHGYLYYTDEQNVSSDIIGMPRAAAVIEGHETHTRTAEVVLDLNKIIDLPDDIQLHNRETSARISITQVVVYGWYDNEMGSYVNMLGDRTVSIAENM